jgi:hypothetical protein
VGAYFAEMNASRTSRSDRVVGLGRAAGTWNSSCRLTAAVPGLSTSCFTVSEVQESSFRLCTNECCTPRLWVY